MKHDACVSEAQLGEVLELPASDPRRAHLDACPRCRALMASYEAFVAPAAAAASAYGASEQRALDAAREALLGGSSAATPRARVAAVPARSPWWAVLFAPRLRPAWALAAVAVVATLAVVLPRVTEREPAIELRGTAETALATSDPVFETSGGVVLAWSAVPDADHYEVRFYSVSLDPLGSVDAGTATSLRLEAARLPAAVARGELVVYRVAALHDGDEVALSETRPLRRP